MIDPSYVQWLIEHSMLQSAEALGRAYSGQGHMWLYPYAETQPRAASARASVWFAAYPPSIITRPEESVLATLGDPGLWQALTAIGVKGVHTGPMKRSGGLTGREYTPSIDGNFDRISTDIDPAFGTLDEFLRMTANATANGAIVIDDIIPGHTGKGADFRLAELGYGDYPGMYHMVEVRREDWELLPPVPPGRDSVNLSATTVDALADLGYIVGQLSRTIFYAPGIKDTDWSATDVVIGVDGVRRRWVYLHYFKDGQPTLNWLDPSFAAARMIIGDALHSLGVLGASGLRLDANGFLGVERRSSGRAWSEGHPLSVLANQIIAGLVRKLGAFTFQELNLTVDDIAAMSHGAADLSYDFITRPAYQHALVTGNTEFLRLMLRIMREQGIDPAALIHALQNHDELTLELVHFWTLHAQDEFSYQGRTWHGNKLREAIRAEMYALLSGPETPYNLPFVTNGVASTTASIIAAALRISDLESLTPAQIEQIKRCHLLLCMYNAFQPGVFALSGWDLVGALTVPPEQVADLMGDGDTRWIHRGAYDLMGVDPEAAESAAGLPKARALYGSLPEQMADPRSFARRLQALLAVREQYRIFQARQVAVPDVQAPSLLVMVHELPDGFGTQVTALNFGGQAVAEDVAIAGGKPGGRVRDILGDSEVAPLAQNGTLRVSLEPYEGKSYLLLND
jgi:trehalose synthase